MAYLALYREWRPQSFIEIIGQEHITRTLRNAVAAGRTGHAYLFSGTRGTGKTTTAKVLAKALNCLRRDGPEPCNHCESCKAINEGISIDVIEVDAASNRGIDEIRDLREKIRFAPAMGKFRIYIIDEVHMLTNEAFNALLKTLEEPPRHGVFILATTEPHKVPLTILSRCQRFDFRRIVPSDIIGRLRVVAAGSGLETEEEALRLIARAADGGLRDALSILDQAASLGDRKVSAEEVHSILGTVKLDALGSMAGFMADGETGAALRLLSDLSGQGKDMRVFAREMACYLRALLLDKISPGASAGDAWDLPERMAAMASRFSQARLLGAVVVMAGAEQDMKGSTLPGIILELAVIKSCRAGEVADFTALAERLEALENKLNKPPSAGSAGSGSSTGYKTTAAGVSSTGAGQRAPVKKPAEPERASKPVKPGESPRQGQPGRSSGNTGEEPASLERVRESWGDIIDAMRRERLPLYHNFVKAAPIMIKGRGLVVGFPEGEELAREIAERQDNKKYLESLIGRFLGGEWQTAFRFYEGQIKLPERRNPPREPAANATRRFGGEEINLEGDDQGTLFDGLKRRE